MLCAWFLSVNGGGQSLIRNDSIILVTLAFPADSGISHVRYRLTQELEYSLSSTALLFSNWQKGDHNNTVSLLHQLRYRSQIGNDRDIKISNSFFHNLGIQYFFDSISRFQPDENTLNTRLDACLGETLSFTVFSNLTTRMFNSYVFKTGPAGNILKTLSSSFLTPLLWTFSSGFGWTLPQTGTLSLGLSAAKFTWIRNRKVYDQQDIDEFYGVPKGKRYSFEYGLSMHLVIDKNFLKRVQWNCDLLIFKNYRKPMDMVIKNLVGIRITEFLKTSIQTRLYYEKEVSKNIQVENLVSFGFYLSL